MNKQEFEELEKKELIEVEQGHIVISSKIYGNLYDELWDYVNRDDDDALYFAPSIDTYCIRKPEDNDCYFCGLESECECVLERMKEFEDYDEYEIMRIQLDKNGGENYIY